MSWVQSIFVPRLKNKSKSFENFRKFSCQFECFCYIFSSVFQNLMSATWMIKIGQIINFSIENDPQACWCRICFDFFCCDFFQSTCVISTYIFTLYMFHVDSVITNCMPLLSLGFVGHVRHFSFDTWEQFPRSGWCWRNGFAHGPWSDEIGISEEIHYESRANRKQRQHRVELTKFPAPSIKVTSLPIGVIFSE